MVRLASKTLPAIALALAGHAGAHDLFVCAGRAAGDGTQTRPFATLEQALERAVRGDVIHVAQGDYGGVLHSGVVVLPVPDLVLLGGWDATFRERDPFRWPSRVVRDEAHCALPRDAYTGMVKFCRNPGRTRIDGFVFDGTTRNVYESGAFGSLRKDESPKAALVTLDHPGLVLANCTFLNASQSAVRIEARGTTVTNCLVLNAGLYGVEITGDPKRRRGEPVLVRNNTVLFTWRGALRGGDAIFLGPDIETRIERNLLGYGQGVAINDSRNFHHVPLHVLRDNAFFQNAQGHYLFKPRGRTGLTVVMEPADLSQTDLADASGNRIAHPRFVIEGSWFDRWADATFEGDGPAHFNVDAFSATRERSGLPAWYGVSGSQPAIAPAYPLDHALAGGFFTPRASELEEIGVQATGPFELLSSPYAGLQLPAAATTFEDVANAHADRAGQRVAFLTWCAGGRVDYRDVYGRAIHPGAEPDSHRIVRLRATPRMRDANDVVLGFLPRGSAAERTLDALVREPTTGEVHRAFLVVGTLRRAQGFVPRGELVLTIEQILERSAE